MSDRGPISPARRVLPRLRLLVAAVVAAMALPAPAIRAQSSDRRPGAFIAAVRTHAPGHRDAPLVTVAAWTSEDVARVLPHVAGEADGVRLLAKALVLHTDIGILQRASSSGGMRARTLVDGREIGSRQLSPQWKIGRMIAEFLVELPVKARPGEETPDRVRVERERRERLDIARRWYRASSALLQEWGDLGFVQTNVDTGLDLLDDDPVLLLYRGTLRQAFADPRVHQVVGLFAVQAGGRPQNPVVELRAAATDLRRALEVDPELVEARVRLAHVLGAQGRHEDAAALIRPAMASPLPPFLDYYGSLILGDTEVHLGRLPEARAAFERAGRAFPDAQAPRVGLSRVSLLEGRAADGLAAIVEASDDNAQEEATDPWWSYFRRHEPDYAALVAELRASAR